MLILDSSEVQYCEVSHKNKDRTKRGLVYNNKIFTVHKSFPQEELETAIKECREDYLDHEERTKIPTLIVKEKKTVGIWMENSSYQISGEISDLSSEDSGKQSQPTSNSITIRELAKKMIQKNGVNIKTRRHKLKLHHRCFLGNEAVDWIAKEMQVARDRAIQIGQKMMDKKVFHHIFDEHRFKDEPLFYRFYDDEKKNS